MPLGRWLPLLLLLPACRDYALTGSGDVLGGGAGDGAPDIVVSPNAIDFGTTGSEDAAEDVRTVRISNVGAETLQIGGVALEDDALDAVYTLSPVGASLVGPGEETSFTVTFTPLAAVEYATHIRVDSNDPDEPRATVALSASGEAPVLALSPASYDFGTLDIGCEAARPLTLSNVGNDYLVVSELTYVSASEDLTFDPNEAVNGPLPWTISPGGSAEVYVDYAPLDDHADEGTLTVLSNDPSQPEAQAFQRGTGALHGQNLDRFEQPVQGKTDILFTVDWSCSMADDIARVQANFDVFIDTLQTLDADYQVAVVTDDDGCVNGSQPYIDDSMSAEAQAALFATMLNDATPGAYTEMGFSLLEAATTSANLAPGGCNAGLVREDATLAMVGVTDEVERSPSPWSYYVSLFQTLKRDPNDLIVHAIAGDYPSGCNGNEPGAGWYEASVSTGGLFLSICAEDWAGHLEALAAGSTADLTSFELTSWPVPATLVVRVDGVAVAAGWTYDEPDNAIVFDDASVPSGGSTVEVTYALFGDCDR